MAYRSSRHALQQLHALANSQGGYFTAKQAARLGYGYSHLTYHVRTGNIERAEHGVYRLVTVPVSEHDDLVRLSFWSRDRADEPQAVASHATALVLHGLTDLLPRSIHVTVPRRFQKKPPPGGTFHRGSLDTSDVEARDGFRVTTPLRTLLDAAASPDVPQEELTNATRAALERGLVRRDALAEAAKRSTTSDRLVMALAGVLQSAA